MAPKVQTDVSAFERRLAKAQKAADAAAQKAEDASWEETDKKSLKKAARVKELELKADRKLQSKNERKSLLAEEENRFAVQIDNKPKKLTVFEIERRKALLAAAESAPYATAVPPPKLCENDNRRRHGISATGIDAALGALEGVTSKGHCLDEISNCSTSDTPRFQRR
jgi:hypothetical protein